MIQDLVMQGLKTGEIAERIGMTVAWVSTVINAPNFQHQLAMRREKHIEQHDSQVIQKEIEASDELKANALRAAQKMVALLDGENAGLQFKAASDILDRVGPSKRQESTSNQTVILIDDKMAKVIKESLVLDGDTNA